MDKKQVFEYIEQNKDSLCRLSDEIWAYAETAFDEFQSMECLCKALEEAGFAVEKGVGDVPTAFVGSWGSGSPVIAFLGEYDALSGLSQQANVTEKQPLSERANGHGCGHNMLGTGALGAAFALKEYLQKTGKSGTVKYFGCPGEEGGSGKAFMARGGAFDGIDFALTWHSFSTNNVMDITTLANYQILYKFKGVSSHAAATPHHGRSALDALELMNVGAQFLREHIIPEARLHYAITNTGGFSPNVVQANAEAVYLIRAPKLHQVEEIYQRVNKIAQGMAMATETEVEIEFIKSCAEVVPNKTLNAVVYKNLLEAPTVTYTEEEMAFAKAIDDGQTNEPSIAATSNINTEEEAKALKDHEGRPMFEGVLPFSEGREVSRWSVSLDVGDVSYLAPTAQVATASWTLKTPPHSWQAVAMGKSGIAYKSLILAAQVLAGTAIDVLEDAALLAKAKEELTTRLGGQSYFCPIPPEVKPRAISKL